MSSDAMYAIRRAGRDRFFAGRWPEHLDEYLGSSLDPRRAPDLSLCLCGAVFVDFDRRALLVWAHDLFGAGPLRGDFTGCCRCGGRSGACARPRCRSRDSRVR